MSGNSHTTVRAIRGPVTLITVGVLFALQNFTPYSFDQTWPVILIVFGLLSLLGRGTEPQPPAPPRPANWPPQGNYPPPSYPPAGGYRQSQYQQPVPPKAGPAASVPPSGTGGPGSNAPSGPAGEAI